jgi:hypothetical protein
VPALSASDLDDVARRGFVRVPAAIESGLAARCVAAVFEQLPERVDEPHTWTRPVARPAVHTLDMVHAARSERLVAAVRELVGADAVLPASIGGSLVVRFPVDGDPGDDGWHLDGSFAGPDGGFWVDHRSTGRLLVLLVLLTDTGEHDAPTRLRPGSHLLMPGVLATFGDAGVNVMELAPPPEVLDLPIELVTGEAGDVYLCHPFLVHAAQRHHGTRPRVLSQPGVLTP